MPRILKAMFLWYSVIYNNWGAFTFSFWGLSFCFLGSSFSFFGVFVFVFWGSSFSCFGVFVFVFRGLRSTVFAFVVFVFFSTSRQHTIHVLKHTFPPSHLLRGNFRCFPNKCKDILRFCNAFLSSLVYVK